VSDPTRVSPPEARRRMEAGTLLVCAYPADAMFRRTALDGAISFREFERRQASLPKAQEIIFY